MKQLSVEIDYENAWRTIFGPYSDKVEVLEAVRCFRCDWKEFALICRIKLKGISDAKSLIGKGSLTNIETLYKERDNSLVVFIEGKWNMLERARSLPEPKLVETDPPEFIDKNRMRVSYVTKDKEISKAIRFSEQDEFRKRFPAKILGIKDLKKDDKQSPLSKLSPKQRQVVLSAFGLGYYDIPRRVTSRQLVKHLKISRSTFVEHLRKAEGKILASVVAGS